MSKAFVQGLNRPSMPKLELGEESQDGPQLVKLKFLGKKGRVFQRPIPQETRFVEQDDVVKPDNHGHYLFTQEEVAYLMKECPGAFEDVQDGR